MSFFNFKVSWISDKQANSQNMYDPEYMEILYIFCSFIDEYESDLCSNE